jgi:hypothetical protein
MHDSPIRKSKAVMDEIVNIPVQLAPHPPTGSIWFHLISFYFDVEKRR